ncbi:MAG: cytochrome c-type biogenesis protein CcmH [Candidatus Accumulibacter sp.]|jgi:cytochrome c-type biogenesis protein CcmH|nr:cytochrome c-type biogenesis protein CcmH [Accumulibacter sp.]
MKNLPPRLFSTFLLILACAFPAFAQDAAGPKDAVEKRLLAISAELRCLVCQNESLASSNAELAADLRDRIRAMILEGKSDDEIMDFMSDRYGDFIRYRPRLTRRAALLWFGPVLLFLASFAAFALHLKRRASTPPERGLTTDADFDEVEDALLRRLSEESREGGAREFPGEKWGARGVTSLALALVIPLAATAVYLRLGTPSALAPESEASQGERIVRALVGELEEKLRANPDDAQSRIRLARIYNASGRFGEAAEAFAQSGEAIDGDAAALVDYAEALLFLNRGRVDSKIDRLISRALARDPDALRALVLVGVSAAERGDLGAAANFWEHLLPSIDPNSKEAQTVKKAIIEARRGQGPGDRRQRTDQ